MATYYLDNSAGTSTSPYDTWAKAAHWTSTVARMSSSGDTIYVASVHAETIGTAGAPASWGWLGTSTSPVRVISADNTSGEPPSTMVFGASVSTTGVVAMTVVSTNSWTYFYGMALNCGTASTAADLTLNNGSGLVVFERCRFRCGAQASGSDLFVAGAAGETILKDCSTIVTHANTAFQLANAASVLRIIGGQTLSTTPNPLFEAANPGTKIYLEGFNCSSLINSFNFINTAASGITVSVRNTVVPDSWTGNLNANAIIPPSSVYELMNTDNADTNYRLAVRLPYGSVYHETTLVKTNGATDGVTPLSWLVSSNTQAEWSHQAVCSPEIVRWNTTVASPITCTIDVLGAVTTLTNRQLWGEWQYLGTSGRPLSLFAANTTTYNAPSSYQAISLADWTSTAITNPVRQLVSTSITPQEAGFIHAKVMLAHSSFPLYVDPVIQIS